MNTRRLKEEFDRELTFWGAIVHNIQPEVPPENIVAMYESALEFGR
ncbi:MAG: hypothetical protein HY236_06025 [Acidobacteria bacterium]|nr:hypothetical protein [Acidobacteriota bacterium]